MPAQSEAVLDERYRLQCAERGVLPFYDERRAEGMNPGFAAMLALRSPPGARSDREFLAGRGHNQQFDSMGRVGRAHILAEARKAGIDIGGKVFMSRLGKPNDPLAWVSSRHDVLKAAQVKGLNLEGTVNYTAPIPDPTPGPPLAPDIMEDLVARRLLADPALAAKCKRSKKKLAEVQESVIEKHAPAWRVQQYQEAKGKRRKKAKVTI